MAKKVFISQEQLKSFENMVVIIPKSKWYVVEGERKPCVECPKCGEGLIGDAAPHSIFADDNKEFGCMPESKVRLSFLH